LQLHTIRTFEHEGRNFEIKMATNGDSWNLKIFVDGKPTKVEGSVSHEIQQDSTYYDIGDPRAIIADALEDYITAGLS
jgi:hypothetical protein